MYGLKYRKDNGEEMKKRNLFFLIMFCSTVARSEDHGVNGILERLEKTPKIELLSTNELTLIINKATTANETQTIMLYLMLRLLCEEGTNQYVLEESKLLRKKINQINKESWQSKVASFYDILYCDNKKKQSMLIQKALNEWQFEELENTADRGWKVFLKIANKPSRFIYESLLYLWAQNCISEGDITKAKNLQVKIKDLDFSSSIQSQIRVVQEHKAKTRDITSFFCTGEFVIRPEKLDELRAMTESNYLEDRLSAHALLCADYLKKDGSDNLYSNVIYHAGMVLTNSTPSWQTIYTQLTILIMHSTGYMPDYDGQIKRVKELKDNLIIYEWDNMKNPIFAHITSADQFTKKKLINMVDYLLVQAYCNLSLFKMAKEICEKMSDAQMKKNASNIIKSYSTKIENFEDERER